MALRIGQPDLTLVGTGIEETETVQPWASERALPE